eukprot:g1455.t1
MWEYEQPRGASAHVGSGDSDDDKEGKESDEGATEDKADFGSAFEGVFCPGWRPESRDGDSDDGDLGDDAHGKKRGEVARDGGDPGLEHSLAIVSIALGESVCAAERLVLQASMALGEARASAARSARAQNATGGVRTNVARAVAVHHAAVLRARDFGLESVASSALAGALDQLLRKACIERTDRPYADGDLACVAETVLCVLGRFADAHSRRRAEAIADPQHGIVSRLLDLADTATGSASAGATSPPATAAAGGGDGAGPAPSPVPQPPQPPASAAPPALALLPPVSASLPAPQLKRQLAAMLGQLGVWWSPAEGAPALLARADRALHARLRLRRASLPSPRYRKRRAGEADLPREALREALGMDSAALLRYVLEHSARRALVPPAGLESAAAAVPTPAAAPTPPRAPATMPTAGAAAGGAGAAAAASPADVRKQHAYARRQGRVARHALERRQRKHTQRLLALRVPQMTTATAAPTTLAQIFQPMLRSGGAQVPGVLDAPDLSAFDAPPPAPAAPSGHTLPVDVPGAFGQLADDPLPLTVFDEESGTTSGGGAK